MRVFAPALVCVALIVLLEPGCWAGVPRQSRGVPPHRGFSGRGFANHEAGRPHSGFAQARGEHARPGEFQSLDRNNGNALGRHEPVRTQPRPEFNMGHVEHEDGLGRPESRAEFRRLYGRGQVHLPEWWAAHHSLDARQQAQDMRRQRGFRNLPQGQQKMLLDRLHEFDRRSPTQQRRMLGRVEMFERLSPERQEDVRGAAQAFRRMPPAEKQQMRGAFQQLRRMPPAERSQMLHSTYGQQFTPQERTVLGNMLSIEPYQPRQR